MKSKRVELPYSYALIWLFEGEYGTALYKTFEQAVEQAEAQSILAGENVWVRRMVKDEFSSSLETARAQGHIEGLRKAGEIIKALSDQYHREAMITFEYNARGSNKKTRELEIRSLALKEGEAFILARATELEGRKDGKE